MPPDRVAQLHAALFGDQPALFGQVAADESGQPVGFALWFLNFSTWEGVHGIYLEDLYVRPGRARPGSGGACWPRWPALRRARATGDWSGGCWTGTRPAEFYAAIGARPMDRVDPYRDSSVAALHRLAGSAASPMSRVGGDTPVSHHAGVGVQGPESAIVADDELARSADGYLGGDIIELTVPALTGYLGVVRTATAGLAARLSFTLDEIEDLRIAVDEACVMLLSPARADRAEQATLTCRFRVSSEALAVTVSAQVADKATLPGEQSFAWQVLTAHAADVTGRSDAGLAAIDLRKRRRRR